MPNTLFDPTEQDQQQNVPPGQPFPLAGPPPGVGVTPSGVPQVANLHAAVPNGPAVGPVGSGISFGNKLRYVASQFPGRLNTLVGNALAGGTPPDPNASPEEVQRARQNAMLHFGLDTLQGSGTGLQRIAHGMEAGQQSFGGDTALNEQRRMQQMGLNQQQQMLRIRMDTGRAMIRQPNESDEEYLNRLQDGHARLIAVGDDKGATAVGSLITTLAKPHGIKDINLGDRTIQVDDRTGQTLREYKNGAKPMDPDSRAALEANIGARQDMIGLRRDAADDRRQNMNFRQAVSLGSKYHGEVKTSLDGLQAVRLADNVYQRALEGDPQAQQEFVNNSIKAVHPGVAVRPGEVAIAENGRPLLDGAGAFWQKVTTGGHLTRQQIENIHRDNGGIYRQHLARIQHTKNRYTAMAKGFGIDDANLFDDESGVPQISSADQPNGAAPAAPAGPNRINNLRGR